MGFIVAFFYLFALGCCSVFVGCGALALVARVSPLVARQRATLYGVTR